MPEKNLHPLYPKTLSIALAQRFSNRPPLRHCCCRANLRRTAALIECQLRYQLTISTCRRYWIVLLQPKLNSVPEAGHFSRAHRQWHHRPQLPHSLPRTHSIVFASSLLAAAKCCWTPPASVARSSQTRLARYLNGIARISGHGHRRTQRTMLRQSSIA